MNDKQQKLYGGMWREAIGPVARVVSCNYCSWSSTHPRTNALAALAKLRGRAMQHMKVAHPKEIDTGGAWTANDEKALRDWYRRTYMERTPPRLPDEVDPHYRVMRTELRAFASERGKKLPEMDPQWEEAFGRFTRWVRYRAGDGAQLKGSK